MKKITKTKIRKNEKRNSKKSFKQKQVQKLKKSFHRFFDKIHCVVIYMILGMVIFSGCEGNVSVLKNGTMEEFPQTEDIKCDDAGSQKTQEDKDSEGAVMSKNEDLDQDEQKDAENLIYVDLGGAVKNPGVYSLTEGSRVFEVIALAGGFQKDAYSKAINQAQVLEDGEQIYVYTVQEAEDLLSRGVLLGKDALVENSNSAENIVSGNKVNLNLANKEVLMTLTGIGSTRAEAILQYRAVHGKFGKIEELMQVEGIKEKTYEKIKDYITV